MVVQRKTQRPVQFELTEQTRNAVSAWIDIVAPLGQKPESARDQPFEQVPVFHFSPNTV
jgi:hypothetical protein